MLERGVASYAVFPIRDGDRVIGAFLCYFSRSGESRPAADERTIDAVGRIISIAYANVRMSEGLNEAAEHERRLTAELRALQELTLLGASTDDLARLAQETIEAVVVSTGAAGGGYILVDPSTSKVDPIVWVGQAEPQLGCHERIAGDPADWPSARPAGVRAEGVWLSRGERGRSPAPRRCCRFGSTTGSPACSTSSGRRRRAWSSSTTTSWSPSPASAASVWPTSGCAPSCSIVPRLSEP